MKKLIAILTAAVILFSFAACGGSKTPENTTNTPTSVPSSAEENQTTENQGEEYNYDAINDNMTSQDGKYEIAFVTDVGQLKDKSFNQGTWEGLKRYAYDNGKSYKYYQPAGGDSATDEDRYDAMKAASDAGAKVVVCAGFLQGTALQRAAREMKDTKFIFIDGWVLKDENGDPLKNVASIDYNEEQSGYLAGYAAVKEGYTKLGFSGGGGGTNAACCRFGYGYVQGAQDAAEEKDITVDMNFSWEYGSSFGASAELQTMINGWYSKGTQVVFVCGGAMCQSVFAAASANEGAVIGVDIDQSGESDTVITSATKGIRESVELVLEKVYSDSWNDIGGVQTTLGAKDDAVSLPTATWKMENFTVEEYEELFEELKDGTVKVDRDYENGLKNENFPNVNLNII